MRLFYCDESNLEHRRGDFFVYGGLSIPGDAAFDLSKEVDRIRDAANISHDFCLKFNPGPTHLSHQEFIQIKQTIIQAAIDAGCELFISVILHNIATNVDLARRNEINRVCYHFNCSLNRIHDEGLVLIDRFEDKKIDSHLREKFSTGLTGMPYSEKMRLDKIIGYHYSAIGQSNFSSIVDIIIGSLRYCINVHTRSQASESATTILHLLAPLFPMNANGLISELYFFFSPKIINISSYRNRYESLKEYLSSAGIPTEQTITSIREY